MASLLQPPVWLSSSRNGNPITHLFSPSKSTASPFKASLSVSPPEPEPEPEPAPADPIKLAFEKAKSYRKSKQSETKPNLAGKSGGNGSSSSGSDGGKVDSVKAAMEKAKEYKKNKVVNSDLGLKEEKGSNSGLGFKEERGETKEQNLVISSIDFVGLGFADKKMTRGLPAGLLPVIDTFPEEDIADVEIIVGNFGDSKAPTEEEDSTDLYKPKVSTWGVFPRPGNISKTFGGGKVIRPGDELETAEERAAKDARTRELIAAYKRQMGLNIDPKLKSECEKTLKDGDSLMDAGRLKDALPCYEEVMKKLPFKSEVHGLAALQWSICQDSLTRGSEARSMYEKLQSHPSPKVNKRAKQFLFSFQAMEVMKVGNSRCSVKNTGYQDYFEAFVDDKTNVSSDEDEDQESAVANAFPYIALLLSPILVVLFFAIQKGS